MKPIVIMMGLIMCWPMLQAGVWTDDFDKQAVDKEWTCHDRREKESKVEVKDGFLGIINPKGKWEQMTPDKAMLERDVPASSQDLVVSGIFFSAPDKPQGCWHGVFIFGEDQMVFACLVVKRPIKHRKP